MIMGDDLRSKSLIPYVSLATEYLLCTPFHGYTGLLHVWDGVMLWLAQRWLVDCGGCRWRLPAARARLAGCCHQATYVCQPLIPPQHQSPHPHTHSHAHCMCINNALLILQILMIKTDISVMASKIPNWGGGNLIWVSYYLWKIYSIVLITKFFNLNGLEVSSLLIKSTLASAL